MPTTKRAVIFDMDGLLVDSEPLWWRAGVEILRTVGVHLSDEHLHETIGLRTDVAVAHWYGRFPWTGKTHKEIEDDVHARVLQLIVSSAQPLPGVLSLVRFLFEERVPIGLCSSSSYSIIDTVLAKLEIKDYFQVIHSAEDEPYGKPHPGPYISCASRLGVMPQRCIACEDSLSGAISAKAAQMKVVAVPNPVSARVSSFDFCDVRLDSLTEFTPDLLARLLPA